VVGVVSSFRVTQELDNNQLECEVVLAPKLWRLGMFHRSRVFQDLNVIEILDKVLQQDLTLPTPDALKKAKQLGGAAAPSTSNAVAALTKGTDYDYALASGFVYPKRDFVMQYQETDLAFLQRLLEDIGIYYFFDDGKLIFSDDKGVLPNVEGKKAVLYEKPAGAKTPVADRIYRYVSRERVVPKVVSIRDYDYESFSHPSLSEPLPGDKHKDTADPQATTDPPTNSANDYARVGTYTEHGRYAVEDRGWVGAKAEDAPDDSAANAAYAKLVTRLERIAIVRAEEFEAQRSGGDGLSNVVRLQAGHVFELKDHFLPQFDGNYLVTGVRHRYVKVPTKVSEEIEVVGLGTTNKHVIERTVENLVYENEFSCLPAGVQYRPPRITPIPRVPGIMTAKVKGTPDDEQAYLDNEGRYRVRFPFDPAPEDGPNKGQSAADPSRPIRLAQPYAGKDYGMHFPNREDAEMVFACLDGDPNRPLGLSVVPTPWTHSPVPNDKHALGSQNPTTGSSTGQQTTYDELKNVLRTQRGHQLVMDDGDGGANVGITLQAGKSESTKSTGNVVDTYWGSKIELGGYRHVSNLEGLLGTISTAIGYFRSVFTRDFPGMASEALGIIASQVMTDDYVDDTFGTTTPVGVNIFTNKNVNVTGKDGVNITSPNLFGMFSTSLMPNPDGDTSKRQYQAEAISKFLVNTIWQEVINGTADELMESKEATDDYKKNKVKNPKTASAFKWTENFKDQRVSALFFTLLQRTGVNISSMGELKMSSLQSTSVAAGQGGLALKSFGDIEQKADLGVEISSHQGIKITTKGRPYKGKGIFKVLRKLGDAVTNPALKMFMGKIESKFSNVMNDPNEMFPIELNNDDGDIFLHTGGSEQKGEGDIMAHVEGKGDVKMFTNKGQFHTWSGGDKGIYLEVGRRSGEDIGPLAKEDATGVLWINNDEVQGFSGKKLQLYVGADYTKKTDNAVTITDGQIELKCGQSSIVMKKNGDITFKGKNIKIEGKQNIDVKAGSNITSEAKMNNKVTGLKVISEAKAQNEMKGPMTKVDAKGIAMVKGPMIKVG
jgi:Rhs element Vgr protein